jgi:predicted DNA-binding protein (MmcQ/YjbR family)
MDKKLPTERLRKICLELPDTTEKIAWGEFTWRINDRMFAMTDYNHHDSGHIAVHVLASPTVQEILVHSDPERFFVPPYVGHKGWVGVRLDLKSPKWDQVAGILEDGYRMAAEKARPRRKPAARRTARSAKSGRGASK